MHRQILREHRLLFYVNDLAIYRAFLGEDIRFHPHKYNSPLRDPRNFDRVPSFVLQLGSNGRVYWHDYGRSIADHPSPADSISFVQEMQTAQTGEPWTRAQATRLIWNTLVEGDEHETRVIAADPGPRPQMLCVHRKVFKPFELEYWKWHWITERYLRFFLTFPLDELVAASGNTVAESTARDPAYVFRFMENRQAFQTYRPLTKHKRNKFRGQNNGMMLHGYAQLPAVGDHLFITSSKKDVMVLRRLGFLAVAPIGENTLKSLLDKARELSGRFSRIYILYDTDPAGVRAADVLRDLTSWEPVFLDRPRIDCPKDPADLVLHTGNYFELSRFFSRFTLSKYHV